MTTKTSSDVQSDSDVTEALFLNLVVRDRTQSLVLVTLAHFRRDESGKYQQVAKQESGVPLDTHVGRLLQFLYSSFISHIVNRDLEQAGYRLGALVSPRLVDSVMWLVEHGACETQRVLFEKTKTA